MVIRNKGLEPSYRYLGELETDRVGGGAEVGCVASDPRTSRVPRPGHHSRSWMRRQILCEDMYLLFICCLYVFTYYYTAVACICMRDPSHFLRYPYEPSGLLLVWPLFRPLAGVPQGRVRYRTEVRVRG